MNSIPVIDLSQPDDAELAAQIDAACRAHGFFVVINHGVAPSLIGRLDAVAREFFSLPDEEKAHIAMESGGAAWRGWFPLGGELTSGVADHKEGLYFGTELPAGDPRPMHGPNLFPERPAAMRTVVLEYLDAAEALARRLVSLIDLALGLEGRLNGLVVDPVVLFRIFAYPPQPPQLAERWGVGEHTDYGLLTLLLQDSVGGLSVKTSEGWTPVPPIEGSYVCNIGDMLERATGGRYRSTPHRARNTSSRLRLSFPLFFDPGWDAHITRFFEPDAEHAAEQAERWDSADPLLFDGTYGDYVWSKVGKVFPRLRPGGRC